MTQRHLRSYKPTNHKGAGEWEIGPRRHEESGFWLTIFCYNWARRAGDRIGAKAQVWWGSWLREPELSLMRGQSVTSCPSIDLT